MNNIPRHKVFISYYHADDQSYKNYLIGMNEYIPCLGYQSIFDDYSVHENEVDGLVEARNDLIAQKEKVAALLMQKKAKKGKTVPTK